MALAQDRPFGRFDHEARADEFIDFHLDVEQAADGAGEPRGGFRLRADQAGKAELRGIRHAVEIPVGLGADADRGADIGDEAVLRRDDHAGRSAANPPRRERTVE